MRHSPSTTSSARPAWVLPAITGAVVVVIATVAFIALRGGSTPTTGQGAEATYAVAGNCPADQPVKALADPTAYYDTTNPKYASIKAVYCFKSVGDAQSLSFSAGS